MDTISANRQVGWLLRVNRRLNDDRELRSGRDFARAFRRDGDRPLAPSHVTRWESGELAASRATIRRYEGLLGLPHESLVTVVDAVARSEPSGGRKIPAASNSDDRRLHALLDRAATAGEMTGLTWGELTEIIEARPGLILHPPRLWQVVVEQLLTELVISEDRAWLQRQEAMSRLLDHPIAGAHAVRACIALADDQNSPVFVEPISLLDVTAHPQANRYVLSQIMRPHNQRAMYGAMLAAVRKVRHRHFDDAELALLTAGLARSVAEHPLDQALSALIVEVGRGLARHAAGAAALRRSPMNLPAHRAADPAVNRGVSRRIAALTQASVPDENAGADEVLAFLVEEAIYSANPDRRLYAGLTVSATPYREPFARALLTEITADLACRGQTFPIAALRTLTGLRLSAHRPLVHDLLVKPGFDAPIRHAAAWATPHCAGRFPESVWRRILTSQVQAWTRARSDIGEGILHGITYGIGTDGHRELLIEIRDDILMPARARATANWLLRAPATIRPDQRRRTDAANKAAEIVHEPEH